MNGRRLLFVAVFLAMGVCPPLVCPPSICSPVIAESPIVTEAIAARLQSLRDDIEYLASEQLRGRSVADDTILQAADYVAGRMTAIGLDTTAVDGNAFQPVAISLGASAGAAEKNRVVFKFDGSDDPVVADLNDAMAPLAVGSGSGQLTGPIALVGYGITAPRLNYDDYAGIDVTGATVIIIRKEPQAADPNSIFGGTQNTTHAFFSTKIQNAIRHGASAVLVVNDPQSIRQTLIDQRNRIASETSRKASIEQQIAELPEDAVNNRETLQNRIDGIDAMVASMEKTNASLERGVLSINDAGGKPDDENNVVPVISIARDVVSDVLERTIGRTLESIESAIDADLKPQSRLLPGVSVTLSVDIKPTNRVSPNVIGVIEGKGSLSGQTVIVGAHYDHVGMGGEGSLAPGTVAVHNGADDNASGTAVMLATANDLVDRLGKVTEHRRVVFIAFTGEERGLLGSRYYVRHPRFALESTVAMVNLDMVGRLRDNELTVYGTGSADLMDQIVESANESTKFDLFKVPTGYGPSDHASFYEMGIPVLFFFTGLHNDYHRPSDDFDKIEFGGLTRITDITSNSTFELATRRERPTYAATDKQVRIRRQMTAFLGVTLADRGDHVVISGLTPGGPAELGGVRVGDRLKTIAGRTITTTSDVLENLRDRSPGDELKMRVIRDGRELLLEPELVARPE